MGQNQNQPRGSYGRVPSIARLMPKGPADEQTHHGARRRSARYSVDGEVSVSGPVEATGILFNISAGGLRIAIDQKVERGDRLDLSVRFNETKTTHERGEVVWIREQPDGYVVGLRFVA